MTTSTRWNDQEESIRPFEWLTSSESLEPIVQECLQGRQNARVLHVGCGSSTWGENVACRFGRHVCVVVNVDNDRETLGKMERRWKNKDKTKKKTLDGDHDKCASMEFRVTDFSVFGTNTDDDNDANTDNDTNIQSDPKEDGSYDLVMDKSTMDCTLCSDRATTGLLCQVYRSLRDDGGVYLLVSFHHIDLLLPLLRDCPGAHWDVQHRTIRREVEDLIGGNARTVDSSQNNIAGTSQKGATLGLDGVDPESGTNTTTTTTTTTTSSSTVWSTGSFQPSDDYRRTVNVLICRKRKRHRDDTVPIPLSSVLDYESVQQHIHRTNNDWYQSQNPLLSEGRIGSLRDAFLERTANTDGCLTLTERYRVLFTEDEREHLTFEHFLDDWQAWCHQRRADSDKGTNGDPDDQQDIQPEEPIMSLAMAMDFLREMQ